MGIRSINITTIASRNAIGIKKLKRNRYANTTVEIEIIISNSIKKRILFSLVGLKKEFNDILL